MNLYTGMGQALNSAMNGGISDYERLHALQLQQQQERAQTPAKADLVSYLQHLNAPAPQTPPPAPMGAPSVPMQNPGPGAGAPPPWGGGPPPVPQQQQMPATLTVAGLLQTIKSRNPNASPDEVLQALQMAAPYMNAQEQQKVQALKEQLAIQKQQLEFRAQQLRENQAQDLSQYRHGLLKNTQQRTQAYIKHLQDLKANNPQQLIAEGMKIQAGIKTLFTARAAYAARMQAGVHADGTPYTPAEITEGNNYIQYLNGKIKEQQIYYQTYMNVRAGAVGQSFEQNYPPPVSTGGVAGSNGGNSFSGNNG